MSRMELRDETPSSFTEGSIGNPISGKMRWEIGSVLTHKSQAVYTNTFSGISKGLRQIVII